MNKYILNFLSITILLIIGCSTRFSFSPDWFQSQPPQNKDYYFGYDSGPFMTAKSVTRSMVLGIARADLARNINSTFLD